MADSSVGGQSTQEGDAVLGDGGGTAVAFGGRGVATAQDGEGPVLAGREGGLHSRARGFGCGLSLLEVILQELLPRRKDFLQVDKTGEDN